MRIPELTWPAQDDTPYDDDLLLDIISGTIVLLIRGRNAWHSTWVRHYLRNATLYSDVSSAKTGAEGQRAPGNVFYIVEAPAIQLRGAVSNVVLTDAHPDNPFRSFTGMNVQVQRHQLGAWIGGVFPGVSVRDAVAAFHCNSGYWKNPRPNEHSLRAGRLDPGVSISRNRGKLQSLNSKAYGSNYSLGWIDDPMNTHYTRQGANAIAKQWSQFIEDAGAAGTEDSLRARLFGTYRDHQLGAMPHSIWQRKKVQHAEARQKLQADARTSWLEQHMLASSLAAKLREAQQEYAEAREDRMHPAETSSGIRAQRERVQAAEVRLSELETLHSEAAQKARDLLQEYESI